MVPGTILGKVLGTSITGAFSQTWPHGTYCHMPTYWQSGTTGIDCLVSLGPTPPYRRGSWEASQTA